MLVIVEATGGYEGLLVDLLRESAIAVAVLNPRRVRDFAKGVGIDKNTSVKSQRRFVDEPLTYH